MLKMEREGCFPEMPNNLEIVRGLWASAAPCGNAQILPDTEKLPAERPAIDGRDQEAKKGQRDICILGALWNIIRRV